MSFQVGRQRSVTDISAGECMEPTAEVDLSPVSNGSKDIHDWSGLGQGSSSSRRGIAENSESSGDLSLLEAM